MKPIKQNWIPSMIINFGCMMFTLLNIYGSEIVSFMQR